MQGLDFFLEDKLGLSKESMLAVLSFFKQEFAPKNTLLIQEGKPFEKMYLITQGYLRFFTYSDKKEITHWIFGAGQLVTDVASFFLQQSAKWNIQALSDTHLFTINYPTYQALRAAVPEWDQHEKLFLIKLMSALENRVYTLLSMSTEERYQYLYQADSNMFHELPQQYLASMMGMTPETLSRIRKKVSS